MICRKCHQKVVMVKTVVVKGQQIQVNVSCRNCGQFIYTRSRAQYRKNSISKSA